MGKSLIGKSVKDFIIVNTPSGEKNFEILRSSIYLIYLNFLIVFDN